RRGRGHSGSARRSEGRRGLLPRAESQTGCRRRFWVPRARSPRKRWRLSPLTSAIANVEGGVSLDVLRCSLRGSLGRTGYVRGGLCAVVRGGLCAVVRRSLFPRGLAEPGRSV